MKDLQTDALFQLEVISNASMNETENKTNVREGILTLRGMGSCVHAISWSSKLAKRVTRGAGIAELLAAADATDKVTYFKNMPEEIQWPQRTGMILDSRTPYHLYSFYKEFLEARNKIVLTSVREEHHLLSIATIRWTPEKAQFGDALTKDKVVMKRFLKLH